MNEIITALMALPFAVGLVLGIWLGERAEAAAWRSKADGPARMLSKGIFYQVSYAWGNELKGRKDERHETSAPGATG